MSQFHEDHMRPVLQEAIKRYGKGAQTEMIVEECSELIKAIQKWKRNPSQATLDNFIEEIADVEIMCQQARYILNCDHLIDEHKSKKVDRLRDRLTLERG